MTCAICTRQARGFGWFNPRVNCSNPHHDSDRWVFCSMRCQSAFAHLMDKTEGRMVDPSEMEIAAMQACLAPLGEYVSSIGMERPLVAYTRNEVLALIEVVVTAFQEHMLIEHERLATQERAFLEERLARQGKTESKGVPR